MIDALTGKRMEVSNVGKEWPYIRLAYSQVPEVLKLLEECGIRHWLGENVISWEDGPQVARIRLGRDGDGAGAQAALDGVPEPAEA